MDEATFLLHVLKDNRAAVAFCQKLFAISQVLDDCYDGDKAVSTAQVKAVFWDALVELPSNVFYQRHFTVLQPLLRLALMDWFDSTVLETGSAHDIGLAFVLRDSLTGVVGQCAYLVGGYDWMASVSAAIRRYFHDEKVEDYMQSLSSPVESDTVAP